MSWGYLSGLLRSERVHALTQNQIISFAESNDVESLMKSLEDTSYGQLFQGHALKEFSQIFNNFYHQKLEQIKNLVPDHTITNIYALKTDLNNLKICYKAYKTNKLVDWEQLSEDGTISPETMFAIVEQGLFNTLPSFVGKVLVELESSSQYNPRHADFLIDKAYYVYRLQILEEASKKDFEAYKGLFDFYKKETDCENIKNFFRAFKMGLDKQQIQDIIIPGGYISQEFFVDQSNISNEDAADLILNTVYAEFLADGIEYWSETKSCTLLEKQIDEYLMQLVENFSYVISGPAVVEESLRRLASELKNLKLIIIGKLNNMSTEEIKGRVRYVRT